MLRIDENIKAINFCEYYIGNDKTEIKFCLESLMVEDDGVILLNYNTETRRLFENEESNFIVVNINQLSSISLFQDEEIQYEKKYNLAEILRYMDAKKIVSNDWISYYIRESAEKIQYILKISIFLSEFNKKQLLDIKLKTLQAVHNRIEQIEIEKYDNPRKKKLREREEKKKVANVVYALHVQDPNTVSPLVKPIIEVKQKEIPKPKVVWPTKERQAEMDANTKPPPEFEFQAKVDCRIW